MVKVIGTIVWLGAAAVAVSAQDAPAFEVLPGYHEALSIRFQPSTLMSWEDLVAADLTDIPLPTRDTTLISRFVPMIDQYGSVEVVQAIPIPDTLLASHAYAVGVAGVVDLGLDSARVVTRLTFNFDHSHLQMRRSWGEIYGSTASAQAFSGGGFVVHSAEVLEFETRPSSCTADDILLGSRAVRQTPDGGYFGRGTSFWDIADQYRISVSPGSEEWLFVRWAPDTELYEAGCTYRYGLFRLLNNGEPPVQMSWTSYGCDV